MSDPPELPDYLTDNQAQELLPDTGGVTVNHNGEPYHLQHDGRWWRESIRDKHFAAAELAQRNPNEYLAEQ